MTFDSEFIDAVKMKMTTLLPAPDHARAGAARRVKCQAQRLTAPRFRE